MAAFIQGEFDFDFTPENKAAPDPHPSPSIHQSIPNRPSPGVYDIIGKTIGLTGNGALTRHTWQKLYTILEIYRSKQYETSRYLLVNNRGYIKDHVAVTARHPSRSPINPLQFGEDYFFYQIEKQARNLKCGVIFVHNHPSGNINPSDMDITVNNILMSKLGDLYLGHIILDHGKFSYYDAENKVFTPAVLEETPGPDPLLPKVTNDYLNLQIKNYNNEMFLRSAIRIDSGDKWNSENWVPIFFLDGGHKIRSLHYYHISEFTGQNADANIINKSTFIALSEGCIALYALPVNQHMFDVLESFNAKTPLFLDVVYNGQSLFLKQRIENKLRKFFPLDASYSSSFSMSSLPQFLSRTTGAPRMAAADPPDPPLPPGNAAAPLQSKVQGRNREINSYLLHAPSERYDIKVRFQDVEKWAGGQFPRARKRLNLLQYRLSKEKSEEKRNPIKAELAALRSDFIPLGFNTPPLCGGLNGCLKEL
jgi:proteasome lid subunit RPN8/RPN11